MPGTNGSQMDKVLRNTAVDIMFPGCLGNIRFPTLVVRTKFVARAIYGLTFICKKVDLSLFTNLVCLIPSSLIISSNWLQ